jgi:transcriptional regulator EpsA
MKTFVNLDRQDQEHLVLALEAGLKVHTRAQFYMWSQGALQGFIAHSRLYCAYGDISKMRFKYETFSSDVDCKKTEKSVADPVNGLLPRIMDDWLHSSREPRMFCHGGDNQVGRRQLLSDMRNCGFENAIAHGVREIQGEFGSFFLFAGLPGEPSPRDAYLLQLLTPHLHLALHRMRSHEALGTPMAQQGVALLSKREIQVLHWVKNGKTNQEISQILSISPPTVKNHLQKIMRKLNVTNRAQAVGKGATLRLVVQGDEAHQQVA